MRRWSVVSGEPSLKRAETTVRLALAGVGFLALLALAAAALILLPYSPLSVYSYEAPTEKACVGEIVTVFIEYEAEEEAHIEKVQVKPEWIAVDVPGVADGYIQEGAEGEIPGRALKRGERAKVRSSGLRVAPQPPGKWLVGGELRVRGEANGVPHVQQLKPRAEEPMTILPADHPKCEGEVL